MYRVGKSGIWLEPCICVPSSLATHSPALVYPNKTIAPFGVRDVTQALGATYLISALSYEASDIEIAIENNFYNGLLNHNSKKSWNSVLIVPTGQTTPKSSSFPISHGATGSQGMEYLKLGRIFYRIYGNPGWSGPFYISAGAISVQVEA